MQKLPVAHYRKRGGACSKKKLSQQKKEARAISAVTTPKSFLLLVEGTMYPSLDDTVANLSTSNNRLFYQWPMTKNTK